MKLTAAKENLRQLGISDNSRCVLLLNNCPPDHELVFDCCSVFACYFPPNVTSLIQPMDQGVIRSLKASYKHDFMEKMISSDLGPREFQSCSNIKDTLFSVAVVVWNNIKTATLPKAWSNLMSYTIGDLMNLTRLIYNNVYSFSIIVGYNYNRWIKE